MEGIVKILFDIQFDFLGFHISVNDFVSTIFDICDWTKIKETDFWSITSTINSILIPTALSLLVLFIMIEFVKEAMNIERLTWDRIIMIFIKFLVVKFCVNHSFDIMTEIIKVCQGTINSVLPTLKEVASTDLGDSIVGLITGNFFEKIAMFLVILLIYIPFLGTIIGILVQVFLRVGKLAIGFSCAPVPIALGVSEDSRNACKSFLLWIAAVAFEGLIILIVANIYVTGLNSIGDAAGISRMVAIMFANGFFMALVGLASSLAEKFLLGH